jgi:arsenate reductase
MNDAIHNILFLCTGNSARSILAESVLNHKYGHRFRAFSAGSHPNGQVNPHAIALLERQGISIEGLRSKSWDEFASPGAPPLHFVFTVCDNAANEVCPVWPGQPMTAHWGVPDPASVEGTEAVQVQAFRDAFIVLERRIDLFANLPFATISKLALGQKLQDIGKS